MAIRVVLEHDSSQDLRDVVHKLLIAEAMNGLAFPELHAEAVEGVQLSLVYLSPGDVAARKVKGVWENDAKGGTEGSNHVYPRQVRRRTQIVERSQHCVPRPGGRRLEPYISRLSVGGVLYGCGNNVLRDITQSQELAQPVAKPVWRGYLGDGFGLQTRWKGVLGTHQFIVLVNRTKWEESK